MLFTPVVQRKIKPLKIQIKKDRFRFTGQHERTIETTRHGLT